MRRKPFVFALLVFVILFECQCASTTKKRAAQKQMDVALFQVAEAGDLAKARELVANGANVNSHGQQGLTPLHNAAYNGNVALAEFLISKGADVNAKSWQGKTPLYFALKKKMKSLLKKHGAQ